MASAVIDNTLRARFDVPSSPLSRVLAEAAYYPRVSDNKTAQRPTPTTHAIRWPYMQINRPDMVSWLVFDCDHGDVFRWEQVGLPAPNLIVANRSTGPEGRGSFHLFYAVVPVCKSPKARSHPQRYLQAIYERMAELLDADPSYHGGPVCKTPGHAWWHTVELHGHEYSLGELHEYFELPQAEPWRKPPDLSQFTHSRHESLFHEVRHYAYSIVNWARDEATYEVFFNRVQEYAHKRNDFSKRRFWCARTQTPKGDLTASQVQCTVRSIARWTWDHYTGDGRCNRGVMQLDKALPLIERQRLAAARTHGERAKATAERIQAACALLRAKGEALTQTAIAKLARLSRQTVAGYRRVIDEFLAPKPPAAPAQEQATAKPALVKFGAYQISPAPAAAGESGTSAVQREPGRPALRLVVGGPAPPLDSS